MNNLLIDFILLKDDHMRDFGNVSFFFQVEDKEEFDKLLELVKNNEVPSDAPTIPDPSTANDGKAFLINKS